MASQPYLGGIFMFAGNFAPRGYQLCAGQILSISQNTALFSILGTTYGGNGTTTFALPDLRSRAPIGVGNAPGLSPVVLGEAAGAQTASILTSNLPPHNHIINASSAAGALSTPQNNFIAVPVDSTGTAGPGFNSSANATMAPTALTMTGNAVPISIQNPYLGINYIIAVQGIFPTRN
jgi:microcystin-dependent protein